MTAIVCALIALLVVALAGLVAYVLYEMALAHDETDEERYDW